MTKTGVEDSSYVYYGSFLMNLRKMWTEPIDSSLSSATSLLKPDDVKLQFDGMKVTCAYNAPFFNAIDIDKRGTIELFTNWVDDTSRTDYGISPTHFFCYFVHITPSQLKAGWNNNTFSDTACISGIKRNLSASFEDMCILVKYTPVDPLAQPPDEFVLDFKIPVNIDKTWSGKELISKQ
jgi:hypothetical protein